jgi:hypothetical protein
LENLPSSISLVAKSQEQATPQREESGIPTCSIGREEVPESAGKDLPLIPKRGELILPTLPTEFLLNLKRRSNM